MKKRKEKKIKVKRHISIAGALLIIVCTVVPIWGADYVMRRFIHPEVAYEGIRPEGIFSDSEPGITIDLDTDEPEKETGPDPGLTPIKDPKPTEPTEPILPPGCVTVPQEGKNVSTGCLLRLDSEHVFTGVTGELVTFEEKNDSYRLKRNDLMVRSEVVEAMNKMAASYETVTGRADLMVYSTIAPYGVEGSLYPTELPDRATGYCIDLCILNDDGTISKISSPNAWLEANAHLHGFVFSYSAEDEDATGIKAAPYHLRYVGKEHAAIMHNEGLTLNQYIDELKKHTTDNPFYYIDGSTSWSVYYVPSEIGGTEVPVPLNASYEISGDNLNGFIVKAEGLLGREG